MPSATPPCLHGNHPRVRGEECFGLSTMAAAGGITPACAGKSTGAAGAEAYPGNHPRVRGEEPCGPTGPVAPAESPPRARERAWQAGRGWRRPWNHPRVRGEEHGVRGVGRRCGGITPACAGKSNRRNPGSRTSWNHPRVRGEESNENAAFEGMDIPPKCKFFVLFRNVLRVPCDSRARSSKAIRLSSIRACYMLCVPNTRADHRVFHGGALFVSDIPVIAKWN